ncbi:MAG: PAS domain-containing protein [Vicinamibacteria bacterium]|nr:PAS domain-containing protein [Vicinamibacteria bacterium]
MSKASGAPDVGIDLPVEAVAHLRAVLERQPVVLTRVNRDGTFLAINEAGLSMLGAQSLEQILGTSLMNMVSTEERKPCQAFLDRALGGQRGSFEVDLVGLTGSRHTFELHASAHPGAPDAIASVLISFRDVTESRRLERSLVESATRQAEQEAAHEAERSRLLTDLELARKAQTDQFAVDEQFTELERRLAEAHDERVAQQKAHADELGRLQEALAEQLRQAGTQSAAFARLDGNDQQLVELRGRYDALDSERQQLLEMAGLLRSEAEARQQTVTELTERLEGLEGERQHAVDTANSLRLDLDERHTLVADLTTRLQLLESDQQQTTEGSAKLQRELESRTSLANELAARIETLEAEQAALRAAAEAELASLRSASEAELAAIRAQAEAEKAQLRTAAEAERAQLRTAADAERAEWRSVADAERGSMRAALEQEHASVRADIESKLQELQARYGTDTGALRDALNESLSEQGRLAEARAAAEEDAAQKSTQFSAIEQALSEQRNAHAGRLVDLEANSATRLAELDARSAEAERAYQASLAELEATHAARLAGLESANAAYQAQRDSAEAAAAARTAERDAIYATQIAELEAALAQSTERADDALAAVQRAEDAFGAERQRLEDALLAAVDGERAARHALSSEIATRTVAERGQRQMQQAIERFAKEAGVAITGGGGAASAPVKMTTSTKALANRLNNELPGRLGDGLTMQLLVSSADVSVAVEEDAAVDAIGAFADSRRLSMLGGQVTVEVAEVTIDKGVGKARSMSPGRYALVAMNIEGPGAQQGFPQEIFNSADPRPWREVKDDLQEARTAILGAGGQVWLTREGAAIMIVEFYLPREGAR